MKVWKAASVLTAVVVAIVETVVVVAPAVVVSTAVAVLAVLVDTSLLIAVSVVVVVVVVIIVYGQSGQDAGTFFKEGVTHCSPLGRSPACQPWLGLPAWPGQLAELDQPAEPGRHGLGWRRRAANRSVWHSVEHRRDTYLGDWTCQSTGGSDAKEDGCDGLELHVG